MKFAVLSLLPLLAAASAVGDRDVTLMENDPKTIDVKDIPDNAQLDVLMLKSSSSHKDFNAQACPPGYPKYCPRYGFCCPAIAQACCPRACCRSANGFCGTDGLCYIWT